MMDWQNLAHSLDTSDLGERVKVSLFLNSLGRGVSMSCAERKRQIQLPLRAALVE